MRALRTIKCCALAVIGFIFVGEIGLMFGESYERPPAVFMGALLTFIFAVMAAAAAVLERLIQSAVELNPG